MVKLKANLIKQVNANQIASDFTSFCNSRSDCLYKYKKRKYHGWINLTNLSSDNKVAQCGWDDGNCDHSTHYGIGGYHNICPIAGINGDYVWPAKLQFLNFNFKGNGIISSTKIKSIKVSFEHRMVAIDTKTGRKYDNFGPNFVAKNGYATKIYFTKGSSTVSDVKQLGSNPKLSKTTYNKVEYTFYNLSASDLLDSNFALNIEYNHNFNTNPGIIYIKNVSIDVNYDNAKLFISGEADNNNLYTSTDEACCSNIIHTISAGYKNGDTILSSSEAPEDVAPQIRCIEKPNNVTVTQISLKDSKKQFRITDKSNIEGSKIIKYNLLNHPNEIITLTYDAIIRPKPKYQIVSEYKANEDFNPNKSYIIFKDGCASEISIYIDSIAEEPLVLPVTNQNSNINLLDENTIRDFHEAITNLSCGTHILYIKRGNESIAQAQKNKVTIFIKPMEYRFRVYTDENADNNLNFIQSKDSIGRYSELIIERIDNEPQEIIPILQITDETQPSIITELTNVMKGSKNTYTIDKYYSGIFYLLIKNTNNCTKNPLKYKITIDSSHKQNYDYLFTRGEKGTAFDFDYLVAWEGDNIREPLIVNSISLEQSQDSLRICSASSQSGLSQIGLVELQIKNTTAELISGIEIELNTLVKNNKNKLEVTTSEWTDVDGIFNQFYNLFQEYNATLTNNVKVLNLTPDNDLTDEENVYLYIDQIESDDSITILLPYRSTTEKTVYLQYLLFEEPCPIKQIGNCDSVETDNPTEIEINVCDSMLTQIDIIGNTDLLLLDQSFTCPDECYTTKDTDEFYQPINNEQSGGITYKITNIDTNDFENQFSRTEIINSNELKPYGYILNDTYYALLDNNNNPIDVQEMNPVLDINGNQMYNELNEPIYQQNKLQWEQKEIVTNRVMVGQNITCTVNFPQNDTIKYVLKTDKRGVANFFIPIPSSLNESYTIDKLLESVLTFEFKENKDYNGARLPRQSKILYNTDKNEVILEYGNNYKRYKPGDIVEIPIMLSANVKTIKNHFYFNAELHDSGDSDQVTILYKICNIDGNQGIFKTTFRTDDVKLIPNEISEDIYCGINSNIDIKAKIEKRVIESSNLNILYINVDNDKKRNKDVEIQVNLGKIPLTYLGNYDFISINIEQGDYSIIEEDNNIIVSWLIGEMDPFERESAIIKIKARDVGLSDIQIKSFDYLHNNNSIPISTGESHCDKCDEGISWRFDDSILISLKDLLPQYDFVVMDIIYENNTWKYITKPLSEVHSLLDIDNAIKNLDLTDINNPLFGRFDANSNNDKLNRTILPLLRGVLFGYIDKNSRLKYENFVLLDPTSIILNVIGSEFMIGDNIYYKGTLKSNGLPLENQTVIVNGAALTTNANGEFEGYTEAKHMGLFIVKAIFNGSSTLKKSNAAQTVNVNLSLDNLLSEYDYVISDITYDEDGRWRYEQKPTSEIHVLSDLNNCIINLTYKNDGAVTFDRFISDSDQSLLNNEILKSLKGLLLALRYNNKQVKYEALNIVSQRPISSILSSYDYVVKEMTYKNGVWKYTPIPTSEIEELSDLDGYITDLTFKNGIITFDRFSSYLSQSLNDEALLMSLKGLLVGLDYGNYDIKYEPLKIVKDSEIHGLLSNYNYIVTDIIHENGEWEYEIKPTSEIYTIADLNGAVMNLNYDNHGDIFYERYVVNNNMYKFDVFDPGTLNGLVVGSQHGNAEIEYSKLEI